MGLDGVELIMAVEERFGIEITDPEATKIRTPRELTNLVLTKVKTTSASECFSQKAFHLLRRSAIREFGVNQKALRPDTPLDNVLPREDRRSNWQLFANRIGATNWPTLRRPTWIVSALGITTFLVFFTAWGIFWLRRRMRSADLSPQPA